MRAHDRSQEASAPIFRFGEFDFAPADRPRLDPLLARERAYPVRPPKRAVPSSLARGKVRMGPPFLYKPFFFNTETPAPTPTAP